MITDPQKSDTQLKTDVLAELQYEPSVKVTDIGVLVKNGTVTLNGYVASYGERWNALRATKRVAGVRAIADDIEVKLQDSTRRTDGDIATAAANQINWSSTTVPPEGIAVTVQEGRITLEGEVEWWYQKIGAEKAVQHLSGVKSVNNMITIKPKLAPVEIEKAIKSAFERNALLDASTVQVETSGNKVTLRGIVRSHTEREEAERVAWAAGGVCLVDNQIEVQGYWGGAE
jgi:osmotically-inducible protein OsmY